MTFENSSDDPLCTDKLQSETCVTNSVYFETLSDISNITESIDFSAEILVTEKTPYKTETFVKSFRESKENRSGCNGKTFAKKPLQVTPFRKKNEKSVTSGTAVSAINEKTFANKSTLTTPAHERGKYKQSQLTHATATQTRLSSSSDSFQHIFHEEQKAPVLTSISHASDFKCLEEFEPVSIYLSESLLDYSTKTIDSTTKSENRITPESRSLYLNEKKNRTGHPILDEREVSIQSNTPANIAVGSLVKNKNVAAGLLNKEEIIEDSSWLSDSKNTLNVSSRNNASNVLESAVAISLLGETTYFLENGKIPGSDPALGML